MVVWVVVEVDEVVDAVVEVVEVDDVVLAVVEVDEEVEAVVEVLDEVEAVVEVDEEVVELVVACRRPILTPAISSGVSTSPFQIITSSREPSYGHEAAE